MDSKPKILVVIHEASLTGAPILAIDLIKLLKEKGYEIGILLDRGGPIEDRFFAIAPTFILKHPNYGKRRSLIPKVLDFLALKWRFTACKKFVEQYDFIFSNTIANGRLLQKLSVLNKKVVTYVHELPSVVDFYAKTGDFGATVQYTNCWAFPSEGIFEVYKKQYGVSGGKILNYYKQPPISGQIDRAEDRRIFAEKYAIPESKVWVVGMGTTTKRKGIDLFLQVAEEVSKSRSDIHFVWVGPYSTEYSAELLESLKEDRKLGNSVSIIGPVKPEESFLNKFDLFVLTSREDPYPLVVLEAAINQVPVISFENGGIVSFLSEGCGYVTNGIDVHEMSRQIEAFELSDSKVLSMKSNAYSKVFKQHLNKQRIHEQFVEIINCQ